MTHAGKRIWIIGASSGIGAALARELAGQGARLVLSARDAEALTQLAGDCGGAEVIPLDLAERATLDAAVLRIEAGGPLDALICTAALYDPARVAELDPEKTAALVQVNVTGTLLVAQSAPRLLRDGGQLVLFGSVAGYIGLPKGQAYSATKAAIINLAETLRVEYAPRIDVRLVCPGFVRTRLTDKNDFSMPAIIEPEAAAREIAKGMSGRGFEIHFPKRFTYALKLLRLLPYPLALRLTARLAG
ncbi:SDR family NAD(P)-dependent oxidoreductase [Salipiger mangrovisoli]|uniref:SDR family NAD(P)-dependent oxidoreductase n=1 Tax=Salipiger mangrovisoli TaxID=2865933 RepID=A0ABR9X5X5_9RHOB|nr:SDR family NAD(P)-dependent oxidoreductase [Salipiger mangrovisoli]MBE9638937.1 SDR family NAD(P)-dependent oxidoreductase [Salipiger mangrovisoli]